MKKTQTNETVENVLGYILERITPFLDKYPESGGSIANIFLSALKVLRHNDQFMLAVLQPLERIKNEITLRIEGRKKEKQVAVANLEMMMHDVEMAAMSLVEVKTDSEVSEVEKYFKALRLKTANLEIFLRKELNLIETDDRQNSLPTHPILDMMSMHRGGMSKEDFTLSGEIDDCKFRDAVKKYFDGLGGVVKFESENPYYDNNFRYELEGKKGFATVSNFGDRTMVTLS